METEPEGSGRDMMQNILEYGEKLKKAKGIHEQKDAFSATNLEFLRYPLFLLFLFCLS